MGLNIRYLACFTEARLFVLCVECLRLVFLGLRGTWFLILFAELAKVCDLKGVEGIPTRLVCLGVLWQGVQREAIEQGSQGRNLCLLQVSGLTINKERKKKYLLCWPGIILRHGHQNPRVDSVNRQQ